jgi:hypothetical protein
MGGLGGVRTHSVGVLCHRHFYTLFGGVVAVPNLKGIGVPMVVCVLIMKCVINVLINCRIP